MPVPSSPNATPVDPTSNREAAPVAPNEQFVLVHHKGYPGSWRLETIGFDSPTWVPAVERFVLAPGSNGVETVADGENPQSAFKAARDIWYKQGMIKIDVHGAIVAEPCIDPRTHKAGLYYRTAWESVEPPPNPTVPAKLRTDRAGWNRWCAELARDGVIDPPHASILKDARRNLEAALERARGETRLATDVRDGMIARAMGELDAFDKAIKPWEKPAEVAPVPAKRGAA